ncbi:MAG TPA: AAA family ATPase [Gemmatimonadaceae bacterium]|nr:AAA family ATPase [Gemmatimonadaceae bacterium]
MLSLTALGALELRDGGTVLLAGRRKPLALLAYLLRCAGGAATRDELATLLWERSGDVLARQSFRQTLSDLRGAVGAALVADGNRIRAAQELFSFDVAEFERDISAGRYAQAIARWKAEGTFLAGLEDVGGESWRSWIERERASLSRQLAFAFERVIDAHRSRAEWRLAAEVADQWRRVLPGDERAWIQLVSALRASGQIATASARHADGMAMLREERGTEPSAAFTRLGASLTREAPGESPGARALMSPEMVGREELFETLTALWRSASGGGACVALIEGDEGAGKTRLCQELVRFASGRRPPALIIAARAFTAEHDRAFATIRPIISRLADAPGLAAVAPEVLADLARIAPELRERFRSLPTPGTSADPESHLARALADVAAEIPVLLVIDDAPDADPASAAVIAALVRRPAPRTVLLLTGRSDAWRASAIVDDLRRPADAGVKRLGLPPLTVDDTRALIASMAPFDGASATMLAHRLHAATGGNAGHVVALAFHLAERGVLAPDASGVWHLTSSSGELLLDVPASMREEIMQRLERLGPDAQHLIRVAAVIGPRVSAPVLESVARLSPAAFQGALGEALMARLLRAAPGAAEQYEFTSELWRQTTYELIAPSERRALHGRAVAVLRSARRTPGEFADLLSHHSRLAGRDRRVIRRRVALGTVVVAAAMLVLGSLLRSHAAPTTTEVLLASVRNLSGDTIFDLTLATAATVALEQSRQVQVVPRAQIAGALARMRRSATAVTLDEPLAREVAEREGVPVVLALAIARLDSTFDLSVRLVEPRSGRDLYADRERVRGRDAVLGALDRLLSRARHAMGESRRSIAATSASLPRVTTSSLDALRAYADGQRAWAAGEWGAAHGDWTRAVLLDSGFAMALSALADYDYVADNNRVTGDRDLARALAHLDRLTAREQLALQAKAASYRGSTDDALHLYGLLAERYPTHDTWYSYGTQLLQARRCGEAIPALEHAVAFDAHDARPWINIATCEQFQLDFQRAVAAYGRAQAIDSSILDRGNINHEFGVALMRLGLLDSAQAVFARMVADPDPAAQALGRRSVAYLLMLRGQYRAAAVQLDSAVALDIDVGARLSAFRNEIILAQAMLSADDTVRARRALDGAWHLVPTLSLEPAFAMFAGMEFARAGDRERAMQMLDTMRAHAERASVDDRTLVALLSAQLQLQEGHARAARSTLEQAEDTVRDGRRLALLTDTYVALGFPDSALGAATRLVRDVQLGDEQQDGWMRASLRIARLALQMGDTARALRAYREYVARWVNGDADLPELVAARRELGRLAPPLSSPRSSRPGAG